nr:unnamed protein product [Callosobruchus chinensis]
MGMSTAKGKLIYDTQCDKPRACIFVNKNIKALKITDFCFRDIAVTEVHLQTGDGPIRILFASVYLPNLAREKREGWKPHFCKTTHTQNPQRNTTHRHQPRNSDLFKFFRGRTTGLIAWAVAMNKPALTDQGMYAQGYADDIVILIRGKHIVTCLEIMQRTLSILERWCVTEGLSVNPSKTIMVPFPKQRNAKIIRAPILFGNQI